MNAPTSEMMSTPKQQIHLVVERKQKISDRTIEPRDKLTKKDAKAARNLKALAVARKSVRRAQKMVARDQANLRSQQRKDKARLVGIEENPGPVAPWFTVQSVLGPALKVWDINGVTWDEWIARPSDYGWPSWKLLHPVEYAGRLRVALPVRNSNNAILLSWASSRNPYNGAVLSELLVGDKVGSLMTIRTLLIASGIEPNPGPNDGNMTMRCHEDVSAMKLLAPCSMVAHTFKRTDIEMVKSHGHFIPICRICQGRLDRVQGGYVHPVMNSDRDTSEGSPAEVSPQARPGSGKGKSPSEYDGSCSASSSRSPSPVGSRLPLGEVVSGPDSAPVSAPSGRASAPVSVPARTVKQSEQAQENELRGRKLTTDEQLLLAKEVFSQHCRGAAYFRVTMCEEEKETLPYAGERRLVTSRGVKETKAPLQVRRIRAEAFVSEVSFISVLLLSVSLLSILVLLASPIVYRVEPAVGCLYGHYCRELSRAAVPLFLLAMIVSAVGLASLVFLLLRGTQLATTISYCPHIVASVVMEFERGTSMEVAKMSLRQKCRRLATLPVPDSATLPLIEGSELASLIVLRNGSFAMARTTTFSFF